MSTTPDPSAKSMEELVSLCKRRGFVYPASEIYGGLNGFWDYGPLGTALKNNIRDHWWKQTVECPPIDPDTGEPVSIVGLDSSIIQNPKTWEASGHVGGFSDPMVDCKSCNSRFRADHLWHVTWTDPGKYEDFVNQMLPARGQAWSKVPNGNSVERNVAVQLARFEIDQASSDHPAPPEYTFSVVAQSDEEALENSASTLTSKERRAIDGLEAYSALAVVDAIDAGFKELLSCPSCRVVGKLTEPREFNLMFDTTVGAIKSDDNKAYLRPETAQGIFLNYLNVLNTMRVKVPFGIAQIGKSFRNEVTPRNFIFRSREFEQMEMEWFCAPDDSPKWYDFWKHERMRWWESLGVSKDNLRFRDHDDDELAHYSKMCVDVEYQYPFTAPGYGELEGVAHRGCFDLTQHQTHSKTKMEYFDQERQLAAKAEGKSKEEIAEVSKYIPNVIEPASGLTRAVLVLLCEAFTPTPDRKGSAYIMSFKPKFAPVKAGIFPLVNKDGMPEIAQKLYLQLREKYPVEYDAKQSIGKRYARMDEIGTPFCFAIDGDTKDKGTVTVRHRDTTEQETINLDRVEAFLDEKLKA